MSTRLSTEAENAQKAFSEFVGRSQPHYGADEWWGYHDAVTGAINLLAESDAAARRALRDLTERLTVLEVLARSCAMAPSDLICKEVLDACDAARAVLSENPAAPGGA